MKLTKCFLVASAAAMAGSLMHNVSSPKNDVYRASILDTNVAQILNEYQNRQGRTYLNNFANFYFSNLHENINYNIQGTCGFVSVGMLLSYYDTYLDDRFVPAEFEQNTFVEPEEGGAIIRKGTESPGVTSDDFDFISSMDEWDYADYVFDNPEDSFQNFLMCYAADNTDGFALDRATGYSAGVGLAADEQVDLLDAYLYEYVGLRDAVQFVKRGNQSTSTMKNNIKQLIQQGRPVIVNFTSSVIGKHSVVAYDCNNNDIFVHAGWKDENGNSLTHINLEDLDRNFQWNYNGMTIDSYVSLNLSGFNVVEQPNNYVTVDANDNIVPVSLKTLAVPYDIKLEYDPNEPNELPVLMWGSLYNERWFNNNNVKFQVVVKEASTGDAIQTAGSLINQTSLQLTRDTAERIVDEYGFIDFTVQIRTILDEAVFGNKKVFTQLTRIGDKQEFEKISPMDHGFPRRSNTYAADFVDAVTEDDFEFMVRKSSNVYTTNSGNIVFDTNLRNSKSAFIEYNFDEPITEIRLAVTENDGSGIQQTSGYNSARGALFVQGFRNAQYYPDLTEMTQDERHLHNLIVGHETEFHNDCAYLTYEFASPVFRVRVLTCANSTTPLALGPRGKSGQSQGFTMYLNDIYVKPVKGEYLAPNGYEFHLPDLSEPYSCNDYVYALSLEGDIIGEAYTPGEYTNDDYYDYYDTPDYFDLDVIQEMCEADAAPGGLTGNGYTFEQIDKYDLADDGCYKIAVAIVDQVNINTNSHDVDFRFFRQNSDGTWSFVAFCGASRIRNRDINGNLIFDPTNVTFKEDSTVSTVRSVNGIRFFQVSREKGTLNAPELPTYFPPYNYLENPTQHLTIDEQFYIIKPPFKPIFTGEY